MMISKLLVFGAYLMAAIAVLIGVFMFSTIPRELGFYRYCTTLWPAMIGFTPTYHYGIPWKYTWEEFYQQDFTGQTAIVTGANSGMGYDISFALAKIGASVTMVCRNPTKCETARNQILEEVFGSSNNSSGGATKIKTMTMDTSSLASVRAFAEAYIQEHGMDSPIDMLFLNAGHSYRPPSGESTACSAKTEQDGIEMLFQVNYLGHHLLYRLLEPLVANSKQPRIIQTSSAASFRSFSYKVATDLDTLHGCREPFINGRLNLSYGQSKLAQILWVKALTRKDPNIAANAFHPGLVETAILNKVLDSQKASDLKRRIFKEIRSYAWQSPDGALTGLYLAVNPEGVRGKYYHPQAQEVVNPLSLDEQLQDDLWEFSNELVKDYLSLPGATTNEEEKIEEMEELVDQEKQETPEQHDSVEGEQEELQQQPENAVEVEEPKPHHEEATQTVESPATEDRNELEENAENNVSTPLVDTKEETPQVPNVEVDGPPVPDQEKLDS